MKDARIDGTSMVTDTIVRVGVECPLLLRETGLTLLGSKMTGVSSAWGEELRSTPGNQALTRDPSSCKAWSIRIGLIEAALTEMRPLAVECMFLVRNVSAELSEPQ